jgi:hypothetical protein
MKIIGLQAMSELATENIRRTFPMKYLVGLLVLVAIIGIGFGIYYFIYWQESPRYALWQMVPSRNAMSNTLFKFIDLRQWLIIWKIVSDVDSLLEKGLALGEDS